MRKVTSAARSSAKSEPQNSTGSLRDAPNAALKIGPISGEMSIADNTTTAEFVSNPNPAMIDAHATDV
jgi:hypothetical protein